MTSVDTTGDGYIKKEQFIEVFERAGVNVDREVLEMLFEVVGEKYNTSKKQGNSSNDDEKVLSITYFINKLFSQVETVEINEIDQVLQNIKATLIYKGLDFSIIFGEEDSVEDRRSRARRGQLP